MNGTALQADRARLIRREGQALTVTRRASTMSGSATTQSIYFLCQPVGKDEAMELQIEGKINAANSNPHRFICAGDEDVLEGVDSLVYGGDTYDLVNVNPHVRQGVNLALHCIGVRVNGS